MQSIGFLPAFRKVAFFLLSLIVYFALYLSTAFLVLLAYCFGLAGRKKIVKQLTLVWTKTVLAILLKKLSITGMENLDPERKYLILANHASAFDINAIMRICPDVSWFGREHLLKIPLFGQFLRMLNYIPMKTEGYRNTKDMIGQLVKNSGEYNIAIFPEGTRTLDGSLSRFHKGFIYIIRQVDIDVLPVTLHGFYQLKPKNRFAIDFRAKVSVTIHPAITGESLKAKTDDEITALVRNAVLSGFREI